MNIPPPYMVPPQLSEVQAQHISHMQAVAAAAAAAGSLHQVGIYPAQQQPITDAQVAHELDRVDESERHIAGCGEVPRA